MALLEKLELQIAASTKNGATRGIKNLTAALEDLAKAAVHTEQVNSVAVSIGRLVTVTKTLGSVPNNIKKIGAALKEFAADVTDVVDISEGLQRVADALDNIANVGQRLSGIGSNIRDINRAAKATVSSADSIPRGGTGLVDSTEDAIDKATNTGSADKKSSVGPYNSQFWQNRLYLRSIKDATERTHVFSNALNKAVDAGKSLVGAGWEKLKDKVSGLVSPMQNLVKSFARIAMYRALRTAIKAITAGFSQGIEHLYQWASLVGDRFKSSMDSLATSAHYVRDSLGAMASPLIDALAPAIEFITEKFVGLLNVVNQFIATFTGAKTWRRAVRTPTEYASGMDEAAKSTKKATEAQKKLNKALMDFDEIHLITTSTTGGSNPSSPNGGSGGGEDYSTHFVEEPVADWIQAIKDAINNGDWYGAGKLLADKLNSIIDNWDARGWGEKLGQKVENGLKFYLGFMDNFRWDNLGIKLSDFTNGLLSKIDPDDLGKAMVAHIKAALKVLANYAWNVDLSSLGTAFGVAFNELFSADTMNDFAMTVAGIFKNVVGMAHNFVTTADFKSAGENLMAGLFTAIENIDWSLAGDTVAKLATGLIDAVISAIDYAISHIDKVFQAIYDFVSAVIIHLWDWLVEKVGGLVGDFLDFVKENLFAGNSDDGNNRKDSYGSSTLLPTNDTSTTSETTQSIKISMDKNSSDTMDKINEMNASLTKLGNTTYKPKVKVESEGISGIQKSLENITKKSWTGKLKIKPVLTTKSGKSTVETAMTLKQFNSTYQLYTPQLKAGGGFPDLRQGSVFVAGEVPGQAEMVGTIGGKTGVASGKEITGIADAVYSTGDTESKLLQQANRLLSQLLAKDTTVTLAPNAAAGKWVNQSQVAYAKASG